MDVFKTFAVDKKKEVEGVWFDVAEGGRVKIARINNQAYRDAFRRRTVAAEQAVRLKVLDEASAERVLIDTLAEAILVDWEGFTAEGEEFPYTFENAQTLLTELTVFRDFVVTCSDQLNAFKLYSDETSEGNLSRLSTGTSNGDSLPTSSPD